MSLLLLLLDYHFSSYEKNHQNRLPLQHTTAIKNSWRSGGRCHCHPFPVLPCCQDGAGAGARFQRPRSRSSSEADPGGMCYFNGPKGTRPLGKWVDVYGWMVGCCWFTIGLCTNLLIFVGLWWWIHGFLSDSTFHSRCFVSARLGISVIPWRSQVLNRPLDSWKPAAYMEAWRMDQGWFTWISVAYGKQTIL